MTYHEDKLDALGDPTRRAVLKILRRGPMSVGEIARQFSVSRPAISQHLRVLKDAGLVTSSPDATRRVYAIDHEGFESLRSYFDDFWSSALDSFQRHVESKRSSRKRPA